MAELSLEEEPPTGSVVAIDWGGHRQEVWVSNSANVGNWYCPDIPMRGDDHPNWYDVQRRAAGRSLTLLVPARADAYAAGFDAGIQRAQAAVEELRLYVAGCHAEDEEAVPGEADH